MCFDLILLHNLSMKDEKLFLSSHNKIKLKFTLKTSHNAKRIKLDSRVEVVYYIWPNFCGF